jgi:hypothetical protein
MNKKHDVNKQRDAKDITTDTPAFESRENMMDAYETEQRARERVGDVPQVVRSHQTGKEGSEQGDPWIEKNIETEEGAGGSH